MPRRSIPRPADFGRLAEEVRAVEAAGADYIHVDVMDGRFVPNITIGPLVVRAVRTATKLPLDVHLMIVEPERYVDEFARAGADSSACTLEASPHLHRTVQHIRAAGQEARRWRSTRTRRSTASHVVLPELAMVLLMTVNPGFGGQRFIEAVVPKIRALRERDRRAAAWTSTSRSTAASRPTRCRRSWRRAPTSWSRARRCSTPGGNYRGAIAELRG